MTSDAKSHRLRYRTLETMRHQYACADCGAEPIVTLDENHDPVLACRYHPAAEMRERK